MRREILRLAEAPNPRQRATTTLSLSLVVDTPNSDGMWISVCTTLGDELIAGSSIRLEPHDLESLVGALQLLLGAP